MTRLEYIQRKIVSPQEALKRVNTWRFFGNSIGFTNGCFDLLHKGHVTYLAKSAQECARLIVGLNTDDSVRRQGKGDDRPITPEDARAMVIASLGFVDLVVLFDEDTPLNLIKTLKPDVLLKGDDYDAEEKDALSKRYIVGSDIVRNTHGRVVTIPLVDGFSTTAIVAQLKNEEKNGTA